jgi:hypothetical protein
LKASIEAAVSKRARFFGSEGRRGELALAAM